MRVTPSANATRERGPANSVSWLARHWHSDRAERSDARLRMGSDPEQTARGPDRDRRVADRGRRAVDVLPPHCICRVGRHNVSTRSVRTDTGTMSAGGCLVHRRRAHPVAGHAPYPRSGERHPASVALFPDATREGGRPSHACWPHRLADTGRWETTGAPSRRVCPPVRRAIASGGCRTSASRSSRTCWYLLPGHSRTAGREWSGSYPGPCHS